MKSIRFAVLALAATLASGQAAVTFDLSDYGVNVDGAAQFPSMGDPLPAGVNISGFDTTTGLGTISVTLTTAGAHYVSLFVDHEIDQQVNTFFNETGSATNTPAAGQSWEIDEPDFIFGNIVDHFVNSALDDSIGTTDPEDVAMALGWSFSLGAGELAQLSFTVSETAPASGFYLTHSDPGTPGTPATGASIYFSSTKTIRPTSQVPDGGLTLLLLLLGVAGSIGLARKPQK